jgi:hypothetical protein
VFLFFVQNNLTDTKRDIEKSQPGDGSAEIPAQKQALQPGCKKEKVILLPDLRKQPWRHQKKDSDFKAIKDVQVERQFLEHKVYGKGGTAISC